MSQAREQRAALERRIWRLAHLLTGDEAGAAGLVDRVLDAQASPESLDWARLDRLVIQQAREMAAGTKGARPAAAPAGQGDLAHRTLATALEMERQPLEAWVLSRIDELDELRMARAMDCSRTALRNHLAAGDEHMRAKLGEGAPAAVAALKKYADSLDPGPIIARHRRKRRKQRNRRMVVVIGIVAIVVMGVALVVLRGAWGLM